MARNNEMMEALSAIAIDKGISEEIMTIARPASAKSHIRLWISDLEPTSTPWVGSSRISMVGRMASHLASATFC